MVMVQNDVIAPDITYVTIAQELLPCARWRFTVEHNANTSYANVSIHVVIVMLCVCLCVPLSEVNDSDNVVMSSCVIGIFILFYCMRMSLLC